MAVIWHPQTWHPQTWHLHGSTERLNRATIEGKTAPLQRSQKFNFYV
ncbi:hypothetical protein IQ260_17615 [Leptolyngbya cf. ectocarpi LEGE 11479]|uniref:Uncharacterized protein n=1 Tax=Leptolyngbya cf. ectocarpi LEGE 11479 TaxID=1828722 RepID=A0A928ZVZ6_LEPEC|nr:hypothetical protein [Leptolyngbya ectocarpi]MBE9068471.1 hypothetical protein [Leptolyngbya cf. ectocarpi LEGE 11479]